MAVRGSNPRASTRLARPQSFDNSYLTAVTGSRGSIMKSKNPGRVISPVAISERPLVQLARWQTRQLRLEVN